MKSKGELLRSTQKIGTEDKIQSSFHVHHSKVRHDDEQKKPDAKESTL